MSERFDIVVIGGGPAGSAAAIKAARRGRRVLLLERGRFPRHKVCGEFVSAESLELLGDLLQVGPSVARIEGAVRIDKTRVFLEGGQFEAAIDPPAASIPRYDLDSALWNAAVASGVDARDNCGGYRVRQRDGATVGDGDPVECDRIVFAGGRRTAGSARRHLVGIKAHFRVARPPESVDLYFGRKGYCGVQPAGRDIVNVCALVDAAAVRMNAHERMRAAFAVHDTLQGVDWEQVTETVTTASICFDDPEPVREGMVRAGDAAGFIDPFLGDGISLALQSGALAGECEDATQYEREYRRRFLPIFRRARRLRRLLSAPETIQKSALLFLKQPRIATAIVRRTRASV